MSKIRKHIHPKIFVIYNHSIQADFISAIPSFSHIIFIRCKSSRRGNRHIRDHIYRLTIIPRESKVILAFEKTEIETKIRRICFFPHQIFIPDSL